MKLRFRNNSLRLRLNQREVERLARGSELREEVCFPGGAALTYVLDSASNSPTAFFDHNVIRISAADNTVKDWAGSDAIGMYFELPAGGTSLRVAIEKDLECKDAPLDERDPFAFPRDVKCE